jgi:hypothetical protein
MREQESLKMDIETFLRTEIDSILMQQLTQKKLYDLLVTWGEGGCCLKFDSWARDWLCFTFFGVRL